MPDSKFALEFQQIYNAFQPKILHYLKRLAGEHEAKDLAQEIFVKISQSLKNFRNESQLSTWIYRIATNAALDRLRSRDFKHLSKEELTTGANKAGLEGKNVWTGSKPLPLDQQLILKEMNECIRDIVEKLPADSRAVIALSEFEELKNQEIAEILCISLDAVKIRLHRARAKLKKELETHCSFYRDERNELACDRKSVPIEIRRPR